MSESDKDRLERLARDGQFVSGIYNYCDRWCERCHFRNKCRSFSMNPDLRDGSADEDDADGSRLAESMQKNFSLIFELLQESAEKWGIDLSAGPDPEIVRQEKADQKRVDEDPLSFSAREYSKAVSAWMKEHEALFAERTKRLEQSAGADIPGHDPLPDAIALHEAVEVIRWYQFFLVPKIARVLRGLIEKDSDLRDDIRGSAKIALIAADRSIGAWQVLGQLMDLGDDVLDLQVRLARIRAELERMVPDARSFTRPGFDE